MRRGNDETEGPGRVKGVKGREERKNLTAQIELPQNERMNSSFRRSISNLLSTMVLSLFSLKIFC